MADGLFYFEQSKSFTSDGTSVSGTSLASRDKRNFSFYLSGTRTGVPGTLDVTLEESPEANFTDASKIRTLATFTQVASTSGDFVEKVNVTDTNINSWVRAKAVVAGYSSGDYTKVDVVGLYDTKI